MGHDLKNIAFRAYQHEACHPGQCAQIFLEGKSIGILGKLNPKVQKEWDLEGAIFLFELALAPIQKIALPVYSTPSKFTQNRRDIAMIVDESITSDVLVSNIRKNSGELLQDVMVFDVYMGKGIESGKKSIAVGLILQHPSRTLVDQEIDSVVQNGVAGLQKEFNAKLGD